MLIPPAFGEPLVPPEEIPSSPEVLNLRFPALRWPAEAPGSVSRGDTAGAGGSARGGGGGAGMLISGWLKIPGIHTVVSPLPSLDIRINSYVFLESSFHNDVL